MNKPEYVKVDNKMYKINTDFRIGLECNKIALDENIGDYERALAIIYKLFGEEGLDCQNKDRLCELAVKYLSMGKDENELKSNSNDNYELDFTKCEGLIQSSFKYDYKYNPYELEYLHLYDFYNDLQNLSSSEFGNCCVLNRIQSILNTDISTIKDSKQASNLAETQRNLRKMYCINKKQEMTKEEKESTINFYKRLGLWKGE